MALAQNYSMQMHVTAKTTLIKQIAKVHLQGKLRWEFCSYLAVIKIGKLFESIHWKTDKCMEV